MTLDGIRKTQWQAGEQRLAERRTRREEKRRRRVEERARVMEKWAMVRRAVARDDLPWR